MAAVDPLHQSHQPSNVLGKFKLIAELGRGGMSEVYLAVIAGPAGFNKLVVIKLIKAELAARPAPEIVVTGHTDRVASLAYNDELSLKRAQAVRSALIAAGIDAAQIEVAGRGEREPAVATADEVDEERNRRVEITVR